MIHLTLIFEDQNIILTRSAAGWTGMIENSERNQAMSLTLTDAQAGAVIGLAMAGDDFPATAEDTWAVAEEVLAGCPDGCRIIP